MDGKSLELLRNIEEKVDYIKKHRACCEETLRELNNHIDIDYVKQSEFIENNTFDQLANLPISEEVKILKAEPYFISDLPEKTSDYPKFLESLRNNYDNSYLVYFKMDEKGSIKTMVSSFNNHLGAVGFALRRARKDQRDLLNGQSALLDLDFIESINRYLFINTQYENNVPGYGSLRKTMMYNGDWLHLNVKVNNPDAKWCPSDSDTVYDEMLQLIDDYNHSSLHPIEKALRFKARFIKIHPFRDGNGRTSRIILNYMLVRYGYPTITIKGGQKDKYIKAMSKAIEEDNFEPILKIVLRALDARCNKYLSIIEENMHLSTVDGN